MKLTLRNHYGYKDQLKSNKATKFIGRGSSRSSTNQYRIDWGDKANCGEYTHEDCVFISAEGARTGRLEPDFNEIDLAIKAKAAFITDTPYHRNRAYNIGERQVANYLINNGYTEVIEGFWEI